MLRSIPGGSTVAVLCLLCAGAAPSTQTADPGYEAVARARYDFHLALTVPGKVARVHVKPGDTVQAGQLLLELEDDEGGALIELFKLRSGSDLAIAAAQKQANLARIEEERLKELVQQNAAAQIELERATVKRELAALEVESMRQQKAELAAQLRQAEARHRQFRLLAPAEAGFTAGVVDAVAVSEGEAVEALKPVLRLVAADPLWVDVPVPTRRAMQVRRGASAEVHSDQPGFEKPLAGNVIHIAQADPASATRLVRVEVPNPTQLPAGIRVRVTFP